MAKKKDLYSADIHPNAGTMVTMFLKNKDTGAESKKTAVWDRTNWAILNKRTGSLSSITSDFEIVGWHE